MVVRLPRDTSEDAVRVQHRALRHLGLAGRAAMTFELGNNLREITQSGIRHQHPEFSEEQTRTAIAKRILGRQLVAQLSARLGKGAAMSQEAFFAKVISALDSAGIPFMGRGI